MRMYWDQTLSYDYTADIDHGSDDLVLHVSYTEPEDVLASPSERTATVTEVGRAASPAAGGTVTFTIDPMDKGLEKDAKYRVAVKADDGNVQRTLETSELFVLTPPVETNG